MPETGTERVVFSLGIAIIGVLLAVIVVGRNPDTDASPASATTGSRTVHARSTSDQETLGTTTMSTRTTVPEAGTVAARPDAVFTLRVAARDDTWLSIRRGSATGDVLFEGTLAKGDTRRYTATRFHVRFGAAANVSATLDGKPLQLPGGTYSATIGPAGLGPRSA